MGLALALWEWGWTQPGSGRAACAAWLDAAEKRREQIICSQQPGLVFIGRINEWHHFQSRSLCSWCWFHSPDGVWAVRVLWKWL